MWPHVAFAAAAALLLAGSCVADFTWEPCDRDQVRGGRLVPASMHVVQQRGLKPPALVQVPFIPDVVTLTPDPPVIGGDVDFGITGKAGESCRRRRPLISGLVARVAGLGHARPAATPGASHAI
jgi:hypothetical protein